MNTRIAVRFSGLAVVVMLVACKARDRQAADSTITARADTAMSKTGAAIDTAARRVESAAGSLVRHTWTDPSILAFTSAAGTGEMRESELATRKATNSAVKAYARQLVNDHRTLDREAKALASKLNVALDTTVDDVRDAMKHARDDIKALTDKPAGADWDKEYIDHQIKDHEDVLDKLQDAAKATTNPELRTMLEKATGQVQQHLTKAKDIKENTLKS
jgi:putative membrane protein